MDFGVVDLLEADDRPTFVIDANKAKDAEFGPLQPVFSNAALRGNEVLASLLFSTARPVSESVSRLQFQRWVRKRHEGREDPKVILYGGIEWRSINVAGRWTVVGAVSDVPQDNTTKISEDSSIQGPTQQAGAIMAHVDSLLDFESSAVKIFPNFPLQAPTPTNGIASVRNLDWTKDPPPTNLSPYIEFIRQIDWRLTQVGAMKDWPHTLRLIVNMLISDPNPAALFWGTDVDVITMIFNEGYVKLVASQNYQKLLGCNPMITLPELKEWLTNIFSRGYVTGEIFRGDQLLVCIEKDGLLEENYLNFAFIPLLGDVGEVLGFYQAIQDNTQLTIAQRRTAIILAISRIPAVAVGLKDFWRNILSALEPYEKDVPFAVLYSLEVDESGNDRPKSPSGVARTCHLQGTIGIRPGCVASSLSLGQRNAGLATSLWKSMVSGKQMILSTEDGTLTADIVEAQNAGRGFGERCTRAILYPLRPINGQNFHGFLLFGLNTRRKYDVEYRTFIERLGTELALSIDPIIAYENDMRKGIDAAAQAALEKATLSEELLRRTRETRLIETRFSRVTQLLPVGIFILSQDGSIVWCNDKWFEITGVDRDDRGEMSWAKAIWPDDVETTLEGWNTLTQAAEPVHFEMRWNKPWEPAPQEDLPDRRSPYTWTLVSAYPEISNEGTALGATGVITDVSELKWAERVVQQRADDAVEAKRQQENFVDMTSHEIRNPLNAIVQCADSIIESLASIPPDSSNSEVLKNCISAAETIAFCTQHQKRIVDDILTLSKLDSDLLKITYVDVQPILMVQHAIRIFEGQSQKSNITLEFVQETSLADHSIDWVQLDPSRVLQVLINLITNAIKFTASETKRLVRVVLGASVIPPSEQGTNIKYFPSRRVRKGDDREVDSSEQDNVFMNFQVQDTGRGLSDEEQDLLFKRFSQASPRTHVQYGGSGLGLFISRELTELQGGEIGLASKSREGSVFAFYVKARRMPTPQIEDVASLKRAHSSSHGRSSPPILINEHNDLASAFVLLVEDNLINQKVLGKQLSRVARNVSVANHGGEALDFIKTTKHWRGNEQSGVNLDIILLDVEMPVMDGLTCIRQLRELERQGLITTHIPTIAVTANARLEQVVIAKEAGMDDLISKPFRIVDLAALMEQTLQSGGTRPVPNGLSMRLSI